MSGLDSGSINFILFGIGVVLLANLSTAALWRFTLLTAASIGFILLIDPRIISLLPMMGFLGCGYAAIIAVRRGVPRAIPLGVVTLIAAYAWLKQYSFLPAESFLHFPYFTLGLSYIFFRVIHLVVEAGRAGPEREIRPCHYLAYTLNFTTLVSGPIQRFAEFKAQVDVDGTRPDLDTIGNAIARLVLGFFKVSVLATALSFAHLEPLAALSQGGDFGAKTPAIIQLVAAYPFFLYCNFSGYMDIVIALARLMGLVLPENFNRPFSATSLIDFWNRWHITLSTWLKTYVYNSLMMAFLRRVTNPTLERAFGIFCFFVTFFLIGVWHGRTPEFIVFGALQGGGMAINKLWQTVLADKLGRKPYRALTEREWYRAVARGLTFTWFAFSQIWFWAAWPQIHALFAVGGPLLWLGAMLVLWLLATIVLELWERLRAWLLSLSISGTAVIAHPYTRTVFVTVMAATALLLVAIRSQPAPGIVYRSF